MSRQLILNHTQIEKKITRLSLQVCEQFFDANEIILCGLNERGNYLGDLIAAELANKEWLKPLRMKLDIAAISDFEQTTNWDAIGKNTPVVITDDVLNTGYTMMLATEIFFRKGFTNISILVLADRNHRKYPIQAGMVGISLSTTLQEHLSFEISEKEMSLFLS